MRCGAVKAIEAMPLSETCPERGGGLGSGDSPSGERINMSAIR